MTSGVSGSETHSCTDNASASKTPVQEAYTANVSVSGTAIRRDMPVSSNTLPISPVQSNDPERSVRASNLPSNLERQVVKRKTPKQYRFTSQKGCASTTPSGKCGQ